MASSDSPGATRTAPRWTQWTPYLGKPPALTDRQWRVMGLVSVAVLFDQYDLSLLSLALKQIQAELHISEGDLGSVGAFVRLGALPSFLIVMLADLIGRRRVMIGTIVVYTLLTGASAFAPDAQAFMWLQFFARTFAVAETILAYVVVTEEFDAAHRGWGIGALAALAAGGNGLALVLFSSVNVIPFGWRALYLVGLVPLTLVAWLRRGLPETARFEGLHLAPTRESVARHAFKPVVALLTRYPARFFATCAVVFLLAFAGAAGGFFEAKYVQDAHGWSPGRYALLGVFGGFIGLFGSAWAGRFSDQRGRRMTAIAFVTLDALLSIAFYQSPGWLLAPIWIANVFTSLATGVALSTFGNELFPTSHRSTAAGARMVASTLGAALGLHAESLLYGAYGSHWTAICLLEVCTLAAPFIIYFVYPETSGKRLEEISPDDDAPRAH